MYLVRAPVGPNLQEDKPEVSGESVPEGGVRLATGFCGIKSKGSTLEYSWIVTIKEHSYN
jgi:hypothetical protein